MAVTLRVATLADLEQVLPRVQALNAHEHIVIDDAALRSALEKLLTDSALGVVFLVEEAEVVVGHAVVTYGYDLEFGGRDSFLTELLIDETCRGRGVGAAAIELIVEELRRRDVKAVHLGVRAENPAKRLYDRTGFEVVPRLTMTRRL